MGEQTSSARRRGAVYFDGRSSALRPVSLNFGLALEIIEENVLLDIWPYAEIRGSRLASGAFRVSALSAPSVCWVEIYDEAVIERILANSPLIAGEKVEHLRTRPATWAGLGAFLAAIVALIWFGLPLAAGAISERLPTDVEKEIGEVADKQVLATFKGKRCRTPQGEAALGKLSDVLQSAGDLRLPATIVALSSKVPNAFALPGGKVYLLSGLLAKAQNQDEILGVLAHELGHVQHRDHLRRIIADGGAAYIIGLLLGQVNGGGALIYASKTLLFAAHSRAAEAQADAFAAQTLAKLGRPAKPMGELLLRVTGPQDDGAFTILHDHPLSKDRLDYLAGQDQGVQAPPVLSDAEWAALKAICD